METDEESTKEGQAEGASDNEEKPSAESLEEGQIHEDDSEEGTSKEDVEETDDIEEPKTENVTNADGDELQTEADEQAIDGTGDDNALQQLDDGVSPPVIEHELHVADEMNTAKEHTGEDDSDVEDQDVEEDEKLKTEKQEESENEEDARDEETDNKDMDEEEENQIPEDFYYNFEELVSKPVVAQDSGLPLNMLELKYSYGYDCKRRNNLILLDENTIIFAAGNLVQILDLKTQEQKYLRSTSGCGIGAICDIAVNTSIFQLYVDLLARLRSVHPSRKYFAIGEKGEAPNINIFEFPSLKLYRILRGGTEQSYASLTFSPDGELLASQGSDPDFMLTVWGWRQEKTTLRTKSFSQDVFRVSFARELEGQLTTAGSGHIRFWKMADTFTGLKLQGELGRFGRTEISDIEGYVELPDGKVLSGTEWGNMLLWDGGLIKVEITCKGKKNCHQGPIMQILLDEGELMTVGVDGNIRVWDFEAIDTADTVDETGMYEMEAMNELHVGSDVQLYCIVKSVDTENEPTIWYAQDANGGIWKLDLSFSHTSMTPEKLFTFHAGPITGSVASPLTHLAVTSGLDKTVKVYDYIQMRQLAEAKFNSGGTAIEFVPLSVDSKGSSVVVGFEDGVVRALSFSRLDEGHVRRHEKQEVEISLKQAFKPHNKSVTTMAFDVKGEILATGSLDGTVFFLYVSEVFDPIGFVRLPGPVRQLIWTPEKFRKKGILVTCEGGMVVEVESPKPGNFDTSHTYEIKGLALRQYKFKSIKSYLKHEEELERLRIEEQEQKKKEEEERQKRIERGLETESEHGDEEEQRPKTPQVEWHPFIPEEPSPVLHARYSNEEGKFWLSMGDFDAGYLYECKFTSPEEQANMMPDNIDKPLRAVPVLESGDVPINVIKFSNSGQQVLFGMFNGQIRVQQLNEPWNLAELGPHWTLNMHDNNYGYVTSIISSFDGTMLLSTGADGNFFQYAFMSQKDLDRQIKENKAKLPSARKTSDKIVDDIDDPNAYSIEDAKQKTEHDRRMKEAEHKKAEVKKKINALRRQFRTIIERNENLPKHLQLSRKEFEIDKEIKQELELQNEKKKELVRKELAWESEKLQIALDKVKKRFKDDIECEQIVVKAFLTPHEVCSFRSSKLSEEFHQLKAELDSKKAQQQLVDAAGRDPTQEMILEQSQTPEKSGSAEGGTDGDSGSKILTTLKGSMGERIKNALQKLEDKEKKRAARKVQWDELYTCKPHDDYEDPEDTAAIKEAQENMGDYKLKTAANYVVPDHLRMNVEKARGRLLMLQEMIHEYKKDFNERLLALRDKKVDLIAEIRDVVNQLLEIQTKLDPEHHLPIPVVPDMQMDEMPEKMLEYTRDSLKKFKVEYEQKKKHAHLIDADGVTGSNGSSSAFGFGFGGGTASNGPSSLAAPSEKQLSTLSPAAVKKSSTVSTPAGSEDIADYVDEDKKMVEEEDAMSPVEKDIHQREQIIHAYNQQQLIQHVQQLVARFDAELKILRHDKFRMDVVMKDGDLRLVTLFEELILLKEYGKTEDILAEKLVSKQQEKMDMQAKILEVQGKIDLKKKDIEKLQEKEKTLMGTFTQSLGENKFTDYLMKVFKHRIKRTKKKMADGQDSDEGSEDESSDDSDWEESDEESESEDGGYDLDVCPPGCDQKLYNDTCMLREKRLDIEEALAEERKILDVQKKELDSLQKKAKIIDTQLKTAQDDLEDFQLQKQRKLNELIIVATLKLHQIQYVVNDTLPHDLSPVLVFASNEMARLQRRIKELEYEKLLQKKHMRESRKKHVKLIKDRRLFEAKILDMEETCSQMMLAKFGTLVDLEKVESVTVNRTIEELKEKLRNIEADCTLELKAFDAEIANKQDEIIDMVRDNTKRLVQKAVLLTEQNQFTNSLDNRQKQVDAEFKGQRQTDVREKQRLIQLVQLQAQELDALKEEILLLSRKGGHILPPVQAPLPQTA